MRVVGYTLSRALSRVVLAEAQLNVLRCVRELIFQHD